MENGFESDVSRTEAFELDYVYAIAEFDVLIFFCLQAVKVKLLNGTVETNDIVSDDFTNIIPYKQVSMVVIRFNNYATM